MPLLSLMEISICHCRNQRRSFKDPLVMDLVKLSSLNFCKHCLVVHMQRQVFFYRKMARLSTGKEIKTCILVSIKMQLKRHHKHKNLLNLPHALSGLLTVFIALASSSLTLGCLTTDSHYQSELLRLRIFKVVTEDQSWWVLAAVTLRCFPGRLLESTI